MTEGGRVEGHIGGVRTAWLDHGEGAAVVALHGIPTSSALFEPLLPHLGGRRLIAPDLLGQGGTAAPPGMLDHAAYSSHLEAFLATVPPPRFDLIVHDFGATLGLAWTARHAERVRRLVVLSTASGPTWRWTLLCAAIYGFELVGGWRALRAGLTRTTRRPGALTPALAEAWARPWGRRRVLRGVDHFARRHLEEVQAGLARLSMPALVIWGDRDEVFPLEHGRVFASTLSEARLVVVPGAGHWSTLDDPERVGSEIGSFI